LYRWILFEELKVFTCFIRYEVDLEKIEEFREYAHSWIGLIRKFGGTHHGYFLPGGTGDDFPDAKFSFPGLGVEGPQNIAVSLFSFPTVGEYERYRREVPHDEECKRITARFSETSSFTRYERNFLVPIFDHSS
jgi:hypothetical protein